MTTPSPRQLRIAHYLGAMDLRDGGVVRAVLDLSDALVKVGHRVTILTLDDRDVPASWPRLGDWGAASTPACVRIGSRRPGGLAGREAIAAARSIVSDADIAHIHAMWIPSNEQIARLCRKIDTPYVWSPHGMLDDWCMTQGALKKRLYHAVIARRSLSGAAAIHCTAEAELAQAGKWFPPGKGVVVPLPFDLRDYRDLPGPKAARDKFALRADEPMLLYLSRLHPKKGVDVLIRTVRAMRDAGERVKLVIAGGGDEPYVASLHALVRELKLEERVVFAGFVKGREKVSLYQAASVFVLPSSQENFGYVVVEAMAAGTPVITTRGVALWPQLERDRVAVLAEPTVEGLLAAIRSLLGDPASARAMGESGREWCLREMDPPRIIDGFVRMYQQAAAKRRPSTHPPVAPRST